jgi:hypothetical protein
MPAAGNLFLTRDGSHENFRVSPEGFALFVDAGREDFLLGVDVSGYEHEDVRVEYAALDEKLPYLEVFLVPQDVFGENYVTIDGGAPDLVAVDAARAEAAAWTVSGFDGKKRLLTVQSAYGKGPDGRHYAIIANDGTGYTPVEIHGRESDGAYRADAAPEEDVSGLRLVPRVTGRVRDGTCLLRLPKRGGRRDWIVRASAGEEDLFRRLDMDEATGRRIGIDEIMSRAAPGAADTHEHDAELEGG